MIRYIYRIVNRKIEQGLSEANVFRLDERYYILTSFFFFLRNRESNNKGAFCKVLRNKNHLLFTFGTQVNSGWVDELHLILTNSRQKPSFNPGSEYLIVHCIHEIKTEFANKLIQLQRLFFFPFPFL